MGQDWILLNLDTRQSACGGKLGEWFPYDNFAWLEESLKVPRFSPNVDLWIKRGKHAIQRGPLFKLSNEIIDMIFLELEDDASIPCFAVTCKDLLILGKPHAYKVMARHACSSWRNGRIIAVGDCCYGLDDSSLPPGLLTAKEKKAIKDMCKNLNGSQVEYEPTLYSFAHAAFEWRPDSKSDADPVWAMAKQFCQYGRSSDGTIWRAWTPSDTLDRRMIEELMKVTYDDGPGAVLCNLSKGEFVREDALDLPKRISSLGHALVSQVCWTHDFWFALAVGEEFEEKLGRGRWAGDRFCIVTESTMPELPGRAEWKDVTREVHELLCHLHNKNYYY
ncbi:hypothetical protein FKP32DRAFT_1607179 [Trametes sanguinea]|nr:hypothetical protein FKP32DRAFT_1607179 [Trametes sanguinea]